MKLSLIMIAKNELENLKRLKSLVEQYIDEWIIVFPPKDPAIEWAKQNGITAIVKDFTQPIEEEIRDDFKLSGIEVKEDYRLFNFAAARNEALKAATGDMVLWLDADDMPIGMDNLKKFIEKNPDTDVFDVVYDYFRDEEGNSISDHIRERVVRNNGKWEWKGGKLGLIHETLLPQDGYEPYRQDIPDTIFRVEHHTDHVNESSLRNHVALLYEYIKTNGEDPRTTYYLGIEFFNRAMYDFCIKILREYVQVSGWDEEKYHAWLKIAEAYAMMEDHQSSRNAYLAAIDEMPHYPHAYLGMGESYHNEEQWAKAIEFIMTGLQKKMPKTKYVTDTTSLTFRPAVYVALSYMQLGKPKEAYEWFVKAAKMNPKHPWVKEYASLFMDAKDLSDYVQSFVKLGQISQRMYPKTLHKLAESIPDELIDQEILMDFKWRYTKPKVWADNSIVYFCSAAFEDWGPESLETGCGGSEEAVIQITKRWAMMGYDVTVFNNCKEEKTVDGVHWLRYERFNPRDIFNILISWRNNTFTEPKVARKKFIDMHDVVTDKRYYDVDQVKGVKIMVKSHYHRTTLPDLPDEQFVVIPNGISLDQFKNPKKTKNNLIYTSSYDRGLKELLEMWPDIKKEVPDASLDCYYGFQLYDTTPWGKAPSGQAWKKEMIELLDQPGVTEHGRVGSEEIAEAYKKADVFAYPTSFPEICCLSLTKAMAAGCVPITTYSAALEERNQGILIEGDINTSEVKEEFKKELIDLLKDEKYKNGVRESIDVSKYSWDIVSLAWTENFNG